VFAIVIVKADTPPRTIVAGAKVLLSATLGAATVSVADAGAVFVAPWVEVKADAGIVFTAAPTVDEVTFAVIVHVAPAAMVAPESVTLGFGPATCVTVPAGQVVASAGVAASVTPVGKRSCRWTFDSATAPVAVFAIVIVSWETPPTAMLAGVKLLAIETGGAFAIVNVADAAVVFDAPCVDVSPPMGMMFV
jgi:hypothetical protein